MIDEEFQPADDLLITDLETARVISDPLRVQILQLTRESAMAAKEISAALDIPVKKLYYHLNLMEKHGLIRVVSTKLVQGIVERRYRATSYLLLFGDELFGEKTGMDLMLSNMFMHARADIAEGLRTGLIRTDQDAPPGERMKAEWGLLRLTPEEAKDFSYRLEELIAEYPRLGREPEVAGVLTYRVLLALFPSSFTYEARYPDGEHS